VIGTAGRHIVRTLKNNDEVREIHEAGKLLEVEEAFEFLSQLQMSQVPNTQNPVEPLMQIGKLNVVHRLDATLFPVPARISLQGALVYNLDNLKEPDAKTYKGNIQGAVKMADGWYQEQVRASSGIELAGSIPSNGVRGGAAPLIKR
jgi:hypothetical protein